LLLCTDVHVARAVDASNLLGDAPGNQAAVTPDEQMNLRTENVAGHQPVAEKNVDPSRERVGIEVGGDIRRSVVSGHETSSVEH